MKILEFVKNRKSVRQFTGESVKEEDLKEILKLSSMVPTSVNGQQISLVYTRNKELISKLADLAGGQPQVRNADVFIVLVADYYRASLLLKDMGEELDYKEREMEFTAATDAGIISTFITFVSGALGYGSTIIGGVLQNKEEIAKLLELPEYTSVMLGITLGVPTESAKNAMVKPKIPVEAFAMEDKYNTEIQKEKVLDYEKTLDEWFKSIGVKQPLFREVIKVNYTKK